MTVPIEPKYPRFTTPAPAKNRAAGEAWYRSVAEPNEVMFEVAKRLGMTSAQVSAIRQGRKPIPTDAKEQS